MKKNIFILGLLVFVIFVVTTSLSFAGQDIPNLVGTWKLKAEGATLIRDKNVGKSSHWVEKQTTIEAEAVVTKQNGRVIFGTFKSTKATEDFIAVIGHDNKSVYWADQDGFLDGKIVNNDSIETIYRHVTPQQTVVTVGKFTRIK